MIKKMFGKQWWWTTLLVIIGAMVCARLGFWQLDRLEQRRAFNAHVEAMRGLPALSLNDSQETDLQEMEYRRVSATGRYDFENQVALRNRYWRDQYGFHLLTPLMLEDGTTVIVDRGWIPAEGNDTPIGWQRYDQNGIVTINGIIRRGQSAPDMGGVPDPALEPGQSRLLYWNIVNLERISDQVPYPILPIYIQPDVDTADTAPPIAYQPHIELTEGSHFGYAGQWFTFAAILLFGYPFFVRSQEKRGQ